MELIEKEEMIEFQKILKKLNMDIADFSFSEIDNTDPKSDEIYGLQGFLTVTRKSTGACKEYVIGDGASWVNKFKKDLDAGAFS